MSQIEVSTSVNNINVTKQDAVITAVAQSNQITATTRENRISASITKPPDLVVATPSSRAVATLGNLDGGSFFDNYNYTKTMDGGVF